MTTPTPWGLTASDRNGFKINPSDENPGEKQFAPAVADNHGGEQFGVAYLTPGGLDGEPRVRFHAFDSALGEMTEVLTGPLALDDGEGDIGDELGIVGIGDGFAAVWQETNDGQTVLKGRATGPIGMLGDEFTVAGPVSGGVPHNLSMSFYAKPLPADPADPATPLEAVGFTAAWVEGAAGEPGAIKVQRFEVKANSLGEPAEIKPAGLDGQTEVGGNDPLAPLASDGTPATGRDPSVAALPDGETVVAWIDTANKMQVRVYSPEGALLQDFNATVPGFDYTVAGGPDSGITGVARVVTLEEGAFGVFWAAQDGANLVVKGQVFQPPGEPAIVWNPLTATPNTVATLPVDHDGRFTANNFGGEGGVGGVLSWRDGTRVSVQHLDGDGLKVDAAGPTDIETVDGQYGIAGLLGGRAVVVGTKSANADGDPNPDDVGGRDIFAQIVDTRDRAGETLVGDRDRGNGRVDARPDIIIGTVGDDFIIADRGDTRGGRGGDDHVIATMGNDTVYGGGGADFLDGGEGTDVALYRRSRDQYSVTLNGDGSFTVKDMSGGASPGADGQGVIKDVEALAFNTTVPTTYPAGGTRAGFGVAPPENWVGTDLFSYKRPEAQTDGTPIAWSMTDPEGLAVSITGTTAADPVSASAVGLLGGYGFVWQVGGNVFLKAYDELGRPDAGFGGGVAARTFRLDQGPVSADNAEGVENLVATMAGTAGVVAVWEEGNTIRGRFASAITGVNPLDVGGEFRVTAPGGGYDNHQAQVAGYEIVTAANDTQELGFNVVYTKSEIIDSVRQPEGEIWLQRFTLFSAPVDGARDLDVLGERAPSSVGLDGRRDPVDDTTPDDAGIRLTADGKTGRDASVSVLHDGEIVAAWVEGTSVKVKVFRPTTGPDGYVAFSPVELDIPDLSIQPGSVPEVVGLGLNFAIGYVDGAGNYKAQVYTPSGEAYEAGEVASFPSSAVGASGARHLVATDLDGTSFALLVEDTGTGKVIGQLFGIAGGEGGAGGQPGHVFEIGDDFTAFSGGTGTAGRGFTASALDDGRVVVAAAGTTSVFGGLYDTRVPGEQIIGPRDGAPADLLVGTTGDDVIDGRVREDELYGGFGNDVLLGGSENDTLDGGLGDDTLLGGSENDSLLGGIGNDLLLGGFGVDVINGGTGTDTVSYKGEFAHFRVNLGTAGLTGPNQPGTTTWSSRNPGTGASLSSNPAVLVLGAEDTLIGIENAIGGEGNDTIIGSTGVNRLEGGGGNDSLDGGAGADNLIGGLGNDMLVGGEGNDSLEGGDGTDALQGGNGADTLDGGEGADVMAGGAGNDTYYVNDIADVITELAGAGTGADTVLSRSTAYTLSENIEKLTFIGTGNFTGTGNVGNNTIEGGAGADSLAGGNGSDLLVGNDGNDVLDGGAGLDMLLGGAKDDSLNGGANNDTLVGGEGNDTLTGGPGNDVFRFGASFGQDRITDFTNGTTATNGDRLDISELGIQEGGFSGAILIAQVDADTVITIDGNSITLAGITATTINAADFIFAA